MSAPRTPDQVEGAWDEVGADIERRQRALAQHTYRESLPAEEVAEHAVAMLAEAAHLARLAEVYVVPWALAAVRAGVPLADVAVAASRDVTELRKVLLDEVALQVLVHQRPGSRYGMDPVVAEQVRALISGASS
ncbi:hypothetical protein DMP17_21995 [Pseudonocardia sp. TMWB2A]|uniref:hypothetical protein n=1 Tax=Pseudonocardia sp. TMWB2A TaxID=687430 RepID=UPI00307D1168